jgi:hypothetical protein
MVHVRHLPPLLRLRNAAAVCGVMLERLDLAAFRSRFVGSAAMELAEKAKRAVWKMN